MKRIMLAAVAISCLAACDKERSASEQVEEKRFDLKVSVASATTKVTGALDDASDEKKINTLDVFVFNGEMLDAHSHGVNVSELTLSCSAGDREVYAFANMGDDMHELYTRSDARRFASSFEETSRRNLHMSGSRDVTLPSATKVNVELNRVASRVVIKKITRDFSAEALTYQTMKIDAIYIINATKCAFFFGGIVNSWHNQDRWNGECPELLYDDVSQFIGEGESLSTPHYFYPYPNPGDVVKTMLVVKATIADHVCYYPIALPALESNKSYEISELVITRAGTTEENKPITSENASFSVTVKDWVVQPVTVEAI